MIEGESLTKHREFRLSIMKLRRAHKIAAVLGAGLILAPAAAVVPAGAAPAPPPPDLLQLAVVPETTKPPRRRVVRRFQVEARRTRSKLGLVRTILAPVLPDTTRTWARRAHYARGPPATRHI